VDNATVDLVTHPIDTTGLAAANVLFGINDAANTTVKIYNEAGEVVEKTGNWLESDYFTTDDKLRYYRTMDEYEALKASGGEVTALDTLVYYKSKVAAGEELTQAEIDEYAKVSVIVKDEALKNTKITITLNNDKKVDGINFSGLQDADSKHISQFSLDAKSSGSACTLTVWYMIGLDFADPDKIPKDITTVYNNTSEKDIDKGNGYVSSGGPDAMMKGAGGSDYVIGNCYTLNDYPEKGYTEIDNAKATQIMVDTLNEGGKINLRVTPDGGTTGGHSVKVDGYVIEDGKLYMTIKDPEMKNNKNFTRYDPESNRLFKWEGNMKVYDMKRKMNRIIPVTKAVNSNSTANK